MKWYWTALGGHVHVRVFMNGGKSGDLCFRAEEFKQLQKQLEHSVLFVEEYDSDRSWNVTAERFNRVE